MGAKNQDLSNPLIYVEFIFHKTYTPLTEA
ncbi:hypothetical protein STPYR_11094 [uncultured Stenotrophomonas sp.]|uniref:Uncharacterized protein n=1 Tax=uncultured Stenotrophomonas sp. TaxID=165438 RepID=A0A1Y5Q8I6_9GAMM|nr:hypothetical protein STPYR_11094 [uncultured Stenotrophomonas sp.]